MANELARLTVAFEAQTSKYEAGLKKMDNRIKSFERRQKSSLDSIKKGFVALGSVISIQFGLRLAKSIAEAGIKMQQFERALKVATGTSEGAAREMAFLVETSNRLGLGLEQTAGAYSKLAAAARGTALQGQETRNIFLGISEASRVLGLSAEQTGGALTAIEQIISKGKVSAEELRGQLGERLPGAFQIAARSIGVTTSELDKMLRLGELTANQLLPKMAEELHKTFGPELASAANDAQAAFNRLNNAILQLKVSLAEGGVLDAMSQLAEGLSSFLNPNIDQQINQQRRFLDFYTKTLKLSQTESKLVRETRDEYFRLLKVREALKAQKLGGGEILPTNPLAAIESFQTASAELTAFVEKTDAAAKKAFDSFVGHYETAEQEVTRKLAELNVFKAMLDPAEFERITAEIKSILTDGLEEISIDVDKRVTPALKKAADEMSEYSKQAARNMQDAFAEFLFDPFEDGMKGMLRSFVDVIRRMLANQAAAQLFNFFGGLLGGGGLSEINLAGLPQKRADGGPVSAGSPYLVGERGPELFMPGMSGQIIPNGAGGSVVNNYTFQAGADVATIYRDIIPMLERTKEATMAQVRRDRAEGRL